MICSKERERHEESVTIEKTFGISIFSLYHELSEQHHKQKGLFDDGKQYEGAGF